MKSISGIGLGTFPFSNVFGQVGRSQAEAIVHTFLGQGGYYLQTAPYYEGVDALMGEILGRIPRDNYYLATLSVKNRQGVRTGKYEAIIAQCEDSLHHLGLDYIDLYMTSSAKVSDATFEETIGAMHDLQTQGKIREIGVTNVNLEQLRQYNSTGYVSYVQNRFSLLNPHLDSDFSQYCREQDIKLIPYNSIEHGILTDRIVGDWKLRDGDLRCILPEFREEAMAQLRQWASVYLKPIASDYHTSIEGLAIWWALQQPNVALCVIGATRVEQTQHSFDALRITGDQEALLSRINEAYRVLERQIQTDYEQSLQQFLGNVYM